MHHLNFIACTFSCETKLIKIVSLFNRPRALIGFQTTAIPYLETLTTLIQILMLDLLPQINCSMQCSFNLIQFFDLTRQKFNWNLKRIINLQ